MSGCLKDTVKAFVLRADLFAAGATLRYKGEPVYQTICGGIFSLFLVIFFIAVFATNFIDVLNKVEISADVEVKIDKNNTHVINDLLFAVGIKDIDFRDDLRYFDIQVFHIVKKEQDNSSQKIDIKMVPCTKDKWKDLGDDFGIVFDNESMEEMLCPFNQSDASISGFSRSSSQYQYVEISVKKCETLPGLDWQCHDPDDIDEFQANYQFENDNFEAKIFLVDTIFAPTQEIYKTKKIQTEIYSSFSVYTGTRGTIKLGQYNITTDQSIWPWKSFVQESGHFIEDYKTHTINLFSTHFIKMIIEKGEKIQRIVRTHGKIDDMLSYVGGLFALLFSFIVFFIGSYAEYKYELAVAQNTFSLDESGRKYRHKDFTFFKFLKYACYDWLISFGLNVKWPQMQQLHEVREEATQQMDIKFVMKKLERLQNINQLLLKERNLVCAQLTEPQTLSKIRKWRKVAQYYDRVMKNEETKDYLKLTTQSINTQLRLYSQESHKPKDGAQIQIPSDFDQQDIEVEKLIIQSYQELMNDDDIDPVQDDVMKKIPIKMRQRLNMFSNQQAYKQALIRGPLKKMKAGDDKHIEKKQ